MTALKFARGRHQTDDIDRAYRQQQLLYAVRDKVVSAEMLPEPGRQSLPAVGRACATASTPA